MRHRSRRPGRAYAAVPNSAMRDQKVSIEARGLLALMMTYSDDWTFIFEHLREMAGVGRDKLRKMLSELETSGYVVREVLRGEGGVLKGTEWLIVDDPSLGTSRIPSVPSSQDDGEHNGNNEDGRPPENQGIGEASDRQPENQGIGDHRPPEKPTAVFSGGLIRRPIVKNPPNPPVGGSGADDRFSEFWEAYPNPVEETAARRAWAAVDAEDAGRVIEAARAYAEDERVKRGFPKAPANWLRHRCWEEPKKPAGSASSAAAASGPADLDALASLWAPKIATGGFVPSSAISAALARHMLDTGQVTSDQLRRAGVKA